MKRKKLMFKGIVVFLIGVFTFIGLLSQPVLANSFKGWRVIEDSYLKDTYVGNDDGGNLVYINHIKSFETSSNSRRMTGIAVDYKIVSSGGMLISKNTMSFKYIMRHWSYNIEGTSVWRPVVYDNTINDYAAYAVFNYLSNLDPGYFSY